MGKKTNKEVEDKILKKKNPHKVKCNTCRLKGYTICDCIFKYECSDCQYKFKIEWPLIRHQLLQECHSKKTCKGCGFQSEVTQDFLLHLNRCKDIPKFVRRSFCQKCKVTYRGHYKHNCHLEYSCEDCGICFEKVDDLREHEISQSCKLVKTCCKCSASFVNPPSYLNHIAECKSLGHEGRKEGSKEAKITINVSQPKSFSTNNQDQTVHPNGQEDKRRFTCNICFQTFGYSSGLCKHRKTNHKLHPCSKCRKKYRIGTTHDCASCISCDDCLLTFEDQQSLEHHIKYQVCKTVKVCQNCKLVVPKRNLYPHIKHCYKVPNRLTAVTCNECGDKYFVSSRVKHKCHSKWRCAGCGYSFSSETQLRTHRKIQQCKQIKTCKRCNIDFTSQKLFTKHLKNCTGPLSQEIDEEKPSSNNDQNEDPGVNEGTKNDIKIQESWKERKRVRCHPCRAQQKTICDCIYEYECSDCQFKYKVEYALLRHQLLQECHSKKTCKGCGFQSEVTQDFLLHLNRCKDIQKFLQTKACNKCRLPYRPGSKHICHSKYTCEDCGAGYENDEDLRKHQISQFCKLVNRCTICSLTFTYLTAYLNHIAACKSSYKTRPRCNFCFKTFAEQKNLYYHLKAFHKDACKNCGDINLINMKHKCDSKYQCVKCGCYFSTKNQLDHHWRKCKKISICKNCQKEFPNIYMLRNHLILCNRVGVVKVFSVTKPLKCNLCGTQYKKLYSAHVKSCRNKINFKKQKCRLCFKRFKTKSELNQHSLAQSCRYVKHCLHCKKIFYGFKRFAEHLTNCKLVGKGINDGVNDLETLESTNKENELPENAYLQPLKLKKGRCCYCFETCSTADFNQHVQTCASVTLQSKIICQLCGGILLSHLCHFIHFNTRCMKSKSRKGFVCGDCSYISLNREDVILHSEQNHRKFIQGTSEIIKIDFGCYSCGQLFGRDENFVRYHAKHCSIKCNKKSNSKRPNDSDTLNTPEPPLKRVCIEIENMRNEPIKIPTLGLLLD